MRTQAERDSDLAVGKLIEAYDAYLEFLKNPEAATAGLLYTHGYRWPEEQVKRGEEMRGRIAELKATVLSSRTE